MSALLYLSFNPASRRTLISTGNMKWQDYANVAVSTLQAGGPSFQRRNKCLRQSYFEEFQPCKQADPHFNSQPGFDTPGVLIGFNPASRRTLISTQRVHCIAAMQCLCFNPASRRTLISTGKKVFVRGKLTIRFNPASRRTLISTLPDFPSRSLLMIVSTLQAGGPSFQRCPCGSLLPERCAFQPCKQADPHFNTSYVDKNKCRKKSFNPASRRTLISTHHMWIRTSVERRVSTLQAGGPSFQHRECIV